MVHINKKPQYQRTFPLPSNKYGCNDIGVNITKYGINDKNTPKTLHIFPQSSKRFLNVINFSDHMLKFFSRVQCLQKKLWV